MMNVRKVAGYELALTRPHALLPIADVKTKWWCTIEAEREVSVKMMNVVFKTRNCALKTWNCALKMMNSAGEGTDSGQFCI